MSVKEVSSHPAQMARGKTVDAVSNYAGSTAKNLTRRTAECRPANEDKLRGMQPVHMSVLTIPQLRRECGDKAVDAAIRAGLIIEVGL